jgi:metal-responsive CopG/Arc/MetJ family transcriptional regulator
VSKAAKVSISLPAEVLERADRERRARGESRSELFRRALDALFREQIREAAVQSYVDGYVAEPETEYEVASAEAIAGAVWEEEDWD